MLSGKQQAELHDCGDAYRRARAEWDARVAAAVVSGDRAERDDPVIVAMLAAEEALNDALVAAALERADLQELRAAAGVDDDYICAALDRQARRDAAILRIIHQNGGAADWRDRRGF